LYLLALSTKKKHVFSIYFLYYHHQEETPLHHTVTGYWCPFDDGDGKSFFSKVVPSIRGGFVVHINKNGANFKVKPEKNM